MAPTQDRDPGFWRGNMEARMDDAEESVRVLWQFKEAADRQIAVMETKLVIFSAIAAALGAMIPGAVAALLK